MKLSAEIIECSDSAYHAHEFSTTPHYSNSIGKIIITKTPGHAMLEHPILNKNYEGEDEADKFAVGKVAHAALLQGLNICEVLTGFTDYRTNDAKALRDNAYLGGKIPMFPKQFDQVNAMVEAAKMQLAANKYLGNLTMDQGKSEQTVIMTKDQTKIKTRLDWLRDDYKLILDYKTTDIASPDRWMRSISDMGIDMQSALYKEAVRVLGGHVPRMVFAIQEVKPPYPMYFVEMFGAYQEYGESRTNRALAIWEDCIAKNEWPLYDQRIQAPDLPAYIEAQWLEKEATIDFDATKVGAGPVSREAFLFGKVKS